MSRQDESDHWATAARNIPGLPITAVMSTPVILVRSDALLEAALATLVSHQVRHLAVVDNDGRCLGVLSDRTVVSTWALNPANLARVCVAESGPQLELVTLTDTVGAAARTMHQLRTDAVVVVDGRGRPAGILTVSDLVRLLDVKEEHPLLGSQHAQPLTNTSQRAGIDRPQQPTAGARKDNT